MELKQVGRQAVLSAHDRIGVPVREFWIDHRWTDMFIAGFVVGVHGLVVWRFDRFDLLSWGQAIDRRGAYTAFAVVVSLTGAFGGVAISQLGSAKGPRAKALKKQVGTELARSWRAIFMGSLGAALVAVVALLIDTTTPVPGHNAAVARWAFELVVAFVVMRFARVAALFEPMITAFTKDDSEPDAEPLAPPLRVDPVALEARRRATG